MICDDDLVCALINRLKADTNIAGMLSATAADTTDPPIYSTYPNISGDRPAKMTVDLLTSRVMAPYPVPVFTGTLEIKISTCGEKAKKRILSIGNRIFSIIYGGEDCSVVNNAWFWDFSTADINIRSVQPLSRSKVFYEDDNKKGQFCQYVRLQVVWNCGGCGAP